MSPGSELSTPRSAIWRVTLWNAVRPVLVKANVTIGSLPACWSEVCFGFLMSVPESPGLSLTSHQRSGSGALASGFSPRTTRIPVGTSTTSAFFACSGVRSASAASLLSEGCPLLSGCLEVLSNA